MNKVAQLRRQARRCIRLAEETSDTEIIAALEKLGRELEASAQKLDRASKAQHGARRSGYEN
jgi:hypothetical protein